MVLCFLDGRAGQGIHVIVHAVNISKELFCFVEKVLLNMDCRGPKSLSFWDGKFQEAKTFRMKCVNRFCNKKRVNFFTAKKCV